MAQLVEDLVAEHLISEGFVVDMFSEFDILASKDGRGYPTDVKYLRRPRSYHVFPLIEQILMAKSEKDSQWPNAVFQLFIVTPEREMLAEVRRGLTQSLNKLGSIPLRVVLAHVSSGRDGATLSILD